MKPSSDPASPTPQDLLNDLHALVTEAEAMMGDSLSASSGDAVAALRARFDAAQERLRGLVAGARNTVVAGARRTDEVIRANPYPALAIAAGAGLALGVLLGRRDR